MLTFLHCQFDALCHHFNKPFMYVMWLKRLNDNIPIVDSIIVRDHRNAGGGHACISRLERLRPNILIYSTVFAAGLTFFVLLSCYTLIFIHGFSFLPRDATQSAVMPQ